MGRQGHEKRDVAPNDVVRGQKQGEFSVMVAMGVCRGCLVALAVAENGVKINKEVRLGVV